VVVISVGFRDVDFEQVAALITGLGPAVLLVLVPYFVSVSCDTAAWQRILRSLDYRLRFRRLLAVRLSTEALLMSAPGGGLLSDTVKPFLLRSLEDVPFPITLASVALRKLLLVFAEAIYLSLGLLLGYRAYQLASDRFVPGGALPWLVGALAALMMIGVALTAFLLARAQVSDRFYRLLTGIAPGPVRGWLAKRREAFTSLDGHLRGAFAKGHSWVLTSTFGFLCMWLVEGFETFLIASMLGVPIDYFQALAIEAMCSLIRAAVFFVPAGLGFQDLSYTAFFAALGVPHPTSTGASFALLKRAKELVWVIVGYLVLTLLPTRARQALKQLRSSQQPPFTNQRRELCPNE
jgi:hypothetical protein